MPVVVATLRFVPITLKIAFIFAEIAKGGRLFSSGRRYGFLSRM